MVLCSAQPLVFEAHEGIPSVYLLKCDAMPRIREGEVDIAVLHSARQVVKGKRHDAHREVDLQCRKLAVQVIFERRLPLQERGG